MRAHPRRTPANPGGTAPSSATLRAAILRWYDAHRRDLPWRRTRDPYAIWVSEIMLQQTRVEAVVGPYGRFLKRFPDVGSLAAAREDDVLAAWSGLGYYRRARNLHAAAGLIAREHGGQVPSHTASLRKLPGIGHYTAAAIGSIAFGRAEHAVDGNVIRVLARIFGLRGRRDDPELRRHVARRAESLAQGERPGDWTQALMELGGVLCRPRRPVCARCPARECCLARKHGSPERTPGAARVAAPRPARRLMLVARRAGRILLLPSSDERGTPHWALPSAPTLSRPRTEARSLARRLGLGEEVAGPLARFRHRTFSENLEYEVWSLQSVSTGDCAQHGRWVFPSRLLELPVRSPTVKAVRHLRGETPSRRRSGSC